MDTKYFKINDLHIDQDKIKAAASLLKAGELVAFPTETVYGLGADASNEAAVAKIFAAKGRPQDNPLIVHMATKAQLVQFVTQLPNYAEKLLDAFTPGPITFVLPHKGGAASNVTAGLATIGVRIPDHPVASALIELSGCALAAPSANISGRPSPTTAAHVEKDLTGRIAGIVDGGPTGIGVESTVVDCTGESPVILRPGGITQEMIEAVLGTPLSIPKETPDVDKPKAPGMKYRHYAPAVPLWLLAGSAVAFQGKIDEQKQRGLRVAVLAQAATASQLQADAVASLGENPHAIAAHLYDGLRQFDAANIDLILCEAFSEEGIGEAIMNRLKKAAAQYINLEK